MVYSLIVSKIGVRSIEDQPHNAATLHIAFPILTIPCYAAPKVARASAGMVLNDKPEYPVSTIRRVNFHNGIFAIDGTISSHWKCFGKMDIEDWSMLSYQ